MNRIKELVNKSITVSLVKLVSLMRASVSVYKPLMITEPVVPSARLQACVRNCILATCSAWSKRSPTRMVQSFSNTLKSSKRKKDSAGRMRLWGYKNEQIPVLLFLPERYYIAHEKYLLFSDCLLSLHTFSCFITRRIREHGKVSGKRKGQRHSPQCGRGCDLKNELYSCISDWASLPNLLRKPMQCKIFKRHLKAKHFSRQPLYSNHS